MRWTLNNNYRKLKYQNHTFHFELIRDSIISSSPESTRSLGNRFAKKLKTGDLVALNGELGSGKTQFAKGICLGLNVNETVVSPSYLHMIGYKGKFQVYHFDFFLDVSLDSILSMGFSEIIDSNCVVLIEWANRFPEVLPEHRWEVNLFWDTEIETTRRIEIVRIT